jgi:hypothetical protein
MADGEPMPSTRLHCLLPGIVGGTAVGLFGPMLMLVVGFLGSLLKEGKAWMPEFWVVGEFLLILVTPALVGAILVTFSRVLSRGLAKWSIFVVPVLVILLPFLAMGRGTHLDKGQLHVFALAPVNAFAAGFGTLKILDRRLIRKGSQEELDMEDNW